jgi:hypothetical protein
VTGRWWRPASEGATTGVSDGVSARNEADGRPFTHTGRPWYFVHTMGERKIGDNVCFVLYKHIERVTTTTPTTSRSHTRPPAAS